MKPTDKKIIETMSRYADIKILATESGKHITVGNILSIINKQHKRILDLEKAIIERNCIIGARWTVEDELKELTNEYNNFRKGVEYALKAAQAGAIKWFAERLKAEQSFYDGQETRIYLTEKDLDNLVKKAEVEWNELGN